MRFRNDSGVPLYVPPTDAGPGLLVQDGEEVDYPTGVAGLTPLDHEFTDGQWQPVDQPAKPGKSVKSTPPATSDVTEGVPA